MVGLFDSGSGGLNTVRYVKEFSPDVDLVYLIDRARAPYGIKTERELVKITKENIEALLDRGAERVLIACCTASTVHSLLPKELHSLSFPIIEAIAKRAEDSTRIGRIGVIATERTVRSHSFKAALSECEVYESALTELVTMIDCGLSDASIDEDGKKALEHMLLPLLNQGIDTLVLGCTHFPALIKTIENMTRPYGVTAVIDSARIGAELITKEHRKLYR